MAIINTPLLGLPYAGAETDETYAVLAGLFVKDGQKLTLPEIVEKYTPTIGTVYIGAADWTAADGTADAYDAKITISGVDDKSMILIYPATDSDTEKAKRLGIRVKTSSGVANDDTFVIVRATGGDPTVTEGLHLVYVALRGNPVWNAGLTPPALPYATVIGVDPYIATEEGDRDDIAASQRLVTEVFTELRLSLSTLFTGWADTNKAVELRLKSADLPTKLDEYRAAKGLIDKTVSDLVNYYTKSQTLTKDEINALVSAIPKFKIEVVTSLPTSNISDTTVYLVKSGADSSNLYTEYIRANGAWERLGTQTVDLTGYATEAWVNDILAAYVKTVDMEGYVTGLLNSYLTKEEAGQIYQPVGDYADRKTTEQALAGKQPKGDYLTKEVADQTYQPKEDGKGLSTNDYTDTDKDVVTELADKLAEAVEPAEEDIPKFFFGGALPQTKTEWVMSFRYVSKTQDISGWCETKAQGNSSMAHPKKNQTVKFFKDEACTEKLKIDFKGWGKENKYCFKANWIDLTHARNLVSARLWADTVKSRADYDEHPELLRTSPNQGAVDGFPVKVYAGGVYQGRYTINIPKDKWTFQMDDDLDIHCALCGENYKSGCFRAPAVIDESDWTDEIHDTVPESILTRWNEVITFVRTSTDAEFKANLSNYFNIGSLIDYLLFGLASCGLDAFAKNQIYLTYDGQIWYASMYDMDSTWGLYYTGAKFVATDYSRTEFEDFVNTEGGNLLYARLAELFVEEIQARWAVLRNGPLTIANIINRFERFTDIAPPYLVEEDYAVTTASGAFANIPSQDTNNIQQIRDYAVKRLAYIDEYVENGLTDEDVTTNIPIYELPAEKTFNASTDYIDTGIKLFETAKDFTIVLDGNLGLDYSNNNGDCIISCATADSNKRGLRLEIGDAPTATYAVFGRTPAEGASSTSGSYAVFLQASSAQRSKIVIRGVAGVVNMVKFQNAGGGVSNKDITPQSVYTNHSNTLLIGAGRTTSGTLGYFWGGTLYDFKIYEYAFSDDEVAAYFSETLEAKA